ncbi:MAG TPA: cation:proton antiporter subunit C [Paraburkholderia sp.]|jgi:multicomponent Na+:H+ antiporter subunit C
MSASLPISTVLFGTGLGLALIGLCGILTHRNVLRIVIDFTVVDTGLNIAMVATGYVTGGTAPIYDAGVREANAAMRMIDPVPSALVVTAIVIGLSVTAMMLAFAIRLHAAKKTLSIDALTDSKW